MKNRNKKEQYGFTLLELLVTVSILAILAVMAMPNYRNFIERQKVRSTLNEWQSTYYLAQREAMRLRQPVIFCGSQDGISCMNGSAHDFSKGWIAFYEKDSGGKLEKVYLQDKAIGDGALSISMNNPNVFKKEGLRFMANGRLKSGAMGTLTVELNGRHTKTISINAAGRLGAS